jgi:hypothetical protein
MVMLLRPPFAIVGKWWKFLATENRDDGGFFPEERLPDPADMMVVCSSLIGYNAITDDKDNDDDDDSINWIDGGVRQNHQIRLAHFSVKEYLLSDRCALRPNFQAQVCQREIAKRCLRYLLYLSEHTLLTWEVVDRHPLARYAAEHWWQHSQTMDGADGRTVINLALGLLTINTALLSWVQLYDVDTPGEDMDLSLTSNDVA